MNKKIQETIRLEVARMFNLLHLNGDYIPEVCELCSFIRNCLVPYTSYRDPYKLVPTVVFIWLRHQNYLITWEEVVEYSSLSYEEFKGYLIAFYELFPFECIMEDVAKIHLEYVYHAADMINKIRCFS